MNKEEIIRVYKKRFKKLLKHFRNLLEDFDKEEIHLFRLQIKKLRAFILLVSQASLQDPIKIHGPLKEFYNSAGDLRSREGDRFPKNRRASGAFAHQRDPFA